MIRRVLVSFVVVAISMAAAAQSEQKYGAVVDFPITLAGNVGEVRSDHFHSGIDIKAARGIGSPVMAAADGYVSRVGVSPTGYGNVLYVTHPDGETTVYGHLHGFKKSISNWVYAQQMARKSFRVDLYPTANQFAVKRGEVIGYLGNSGSSGGPHLHYEIRDAYGCPINIVQRGIVSPTDKISPNIYSVTLYQADSVEGVVRFVASDQITIKQNRDGDWEMSDTVLRASRPFYLAYEVIDYKNGSSNTMGVYSLTQKVDGMEQFSFAVDRISFATTRYINTFVQFDRNRASRRHVVRAYVSANNALSIYRNVANRGIVSPPLPNGARQVEATIYDDVGNNSSVMFSVIFDNNSVESSPVQPNMHKVEWDDEVVVRDSDLQVTFAPRSLYDTALLPFSVDASGVIEVGDETVPLQKAVKVRVKCPLDEPLRTKALLMSCSSKAVNSATYSDGWLTADLRRLGRYTVVYDTVAPKITPLALKNGVLAWKVTDDLAGVGTYELTVDGEWALAQWDPKSSTMSYRVRSASNEPKARKISLRVTDYKQNTKTSKQVVKW